MKKTKSTYLALIAALVLPMAASADVIVSTSIGQYDVYLLPLDSYYDQVDVLDDQVWWGNDLLAKEFAGLVGEAFGLVNYDNVNGPYFATGVLGSSSYGAWVSPTTCGDPAGCIGTLSYIYNDRYYAAATLVPAPGTLALVGIGLVVLGLSRRRRQI